MERRIDAAAQRLDRAAARLTHPRQRLERSQLRLTILDQGLRASMARHLASRQACVAGLGLRLKARRPDPAQKRAHLDALGQRLQRATHGLLARHQARLDALQQHLAHLDPRAVLARGYSITRHADGSIVRSATNLTAGSSIRIEMSDGSVGATVNKD